MLPKAYQMNKKILITGAGSFIAQKVACFLKEKNHDIIGTSPFDEKVKHFDTIYQLKLGESLKEVLENEEIAFIVHCAFDKHHTQLNKPGTIQWAQEALDVNIRNQVFLSSISAFNNSFTEYGQSKFAVEKWFLEHNLRVVKLGLVFGNGGVVKTMFDLIRKYPIFPMIDAGNTLTYVSDIDTVAGILSGIVEGEVSNKNMGALYLQQNKPYRFKEILKEIKKQSGSFCLLIPIPFWLVYTPVKLFEVLHIKIPVTTNNLKGMRQNSDLRIESHLISIGFQESSLTDLVAKGK